MMSFKPLFALNLHDKNKLITLWLEDLNFIFLCIGENDILLMSLRSKFKHSKVFEHSKVLEEI